MLQSTFHSKLKFLLDENVKKRVEIFLKEKRYDVKYAPKGTKDTELAALTKKEQRILVTNDNDFADPELFTKENIFSVVLLGIPQDKSEELIKACASLLKEKTLVEHFAGLLIEVKIGSLETSPLASSLSVKK